MKKAGLARLLPFLTPSDAGAASRASKR